MISLRLKGK
jgi:hypothetical protein